MHTDWRLNERHYGALQGLNKQETAEKHGAEQGAEMASRLRCATTGSCGRRLHTSISGSPLQWFYKPAGQRVAGRYLGAGTTVVGEILVPELRRGQRVLIVAHGNSLRAMVKFLDGMSEDEVLQLNIPTGIPMVYEFQDDLAVKGCSYLVDEDVLAAAVNEVRNQALVVES
ncbi:MAG: hypothetical protein Ct9H300mP16_12470 [Pseudomonadota bacterium]|nr:MAG: hypothetical protein Ct9H300mP16_12470 [Pseudomonadota bacterium]